EHRICSIFRIYAEKYVQIFTILENGEKLAKYNPSNKIKRGVCQQTAGRSLTTSSFFNTSFSTFIYFYIVYCIV
ncbi:MAG: hypothetical protein PUH10_08105, partial [Erysipelotrichaceae bacterium]|nr:hypothetical protein [Erysipelotrichaceae bacterium]